MNSTSLSLIIPAYNEEAHIEECICDAYEEIQKKINDFEIIVINDGSNDKTKKIIDELGSKLEKLKIIHNQQNIGLGATYKKALNQTSKHYVLSISGDGGMLKENWNELLDNIGKYDIVTTHVLNLNEVKSPTRLIISLSYSFFLRLATGINLKYFNGPTIYKRSELIKLDMKSSGFGYASENLTKLIQSGQSYGQVGIRCRGEINSSAVRLKNIISVLRSISRIIKNRFKSARH